MHDALVIGGGPAGAAAALALARAGRSVALVEKARFPRPKVCGEFISGAGLAQLRALGLGRTLEDALGPELTRILVWIGHRALEARMPRLRGYPRALAREVLDTLLLEAAAQSGVEVLQPAVALSLERRAHGFVCRAGRRRGEARLELHARSIIAAHGSWQPGALATEPPRLAPHGSDLLGFKAHLARACVPRQAIALAPFSGGYAGLLERGGGGATFAACIRRDALARSPGMSAGEALLAKVRAESPLLAEALREARLEAPWLGAGPLRPGRRPLYRDGVFVVGNAAGEAHPVVGEGITMALESAALLCAPLAEALAAGYSRDAERAVAGRYARRWRRAFSLRLWASARFAALAIDAPRAAWAERLLASAPALLTAAARLKSATT